MQKVRALISFAFLSLFALVGCANGGATGTSLPPEQDSGPGGGGGGNIIVPALVALGFDPKKASASTSFVVIFSSLTGFIGHMSLAGMNYTLIGWTAAGSAAGAVLGSWLMTDKLKGRQVKMLIGVVLLAIAAKMVWGLV